MGDISLSVCLIACNEESNIGRALASVQAIADEIVVVDTGSMDNTVAVAQSYGAKVVHHPWRHDFSDARNAAIAHASGEWILMLDADEEVSLQLRDALPPALRQQSVIAYVLPVVNSKKGKLHGSHPAVRLFRNRPYLRYEGRIHEEIKLKPGTATEGRTEVLMQPIIHYGYTPEENQRKGRRERNRGLLHASLESNPKFYPHWYYLGIEYCAIDEFGTGIQCFKRAMEAGPHSLHAILSAHKLAAMQLQCLRTESAWELALWGSANAFTKWDSTLLLARVAIGEGDYILAQALLERIDQSSPTDFGQFPRDQLSLAPIRARALWLANRKQDAIGFLRDMAAAHPDDSSIAELFVRYLVSEKGLGPGLKSALGSIRTAQVASACVNTLVRTGQIDEAADLTRQCIEWGFVSFALLYGLVLLNRWDEVRSVVENAGWRAALHAATAAAWFDQNQALEEAMERLPGSWKACLELILTAQPVPEELVWCADILMSMWAEVGCMPLLQAAGMLLPGGPAVGTARAAKQAFHAGLTSKALELAIQVPDQLDSMEVMGLAAFENGDMEATAYFLSSRLSMAPAPVAVYHAAALALLRLGKLRSAKDVLQLGRLHRPHSLLLRRDPIAMVESGYR